VRVPGARKHSARNDGNIWLPYCLHEAEQEMRECHSAGKVLCCACLAICVAPI
jgi:hypothetical protein